MEKGETMGFEIAFRVRRDSEFYKKYFEAKEEREKFKGLAYPFFEKHGIDGRFYQSKSLGVNITREQREKFAGQIRKNPDRKGFYFFKVKSPIEKDWEEAVTNHVDFKRLEQVDFWWLGHISKGSYNLWDADGEIYGYLQTKQEKDFEPEAFMEEIKLSEYYAVIERLEEGA
jgi:hypothetical protein